MNSPTNEKLLIQDYVNTNTATIYLNGHFTFIDRHEFKNAYMKHLTDSTISNIVLDLSKIQYLDSSSLGMLLVLQEHIKNAGKSLVLSRPSTFVMRVFDIANFQNIFVINGGEHIKSFSA